MLQSAAARQEASQALEAATEATAISSSRQKESANHNARCMAPLIVQTALLAVLTANFVDQPMAISSNTFDL